MIRILSVLLLLALLPALPSIAGKTAPETPHGHAAQSGPSDKCALRFNPATLDSYCEDNGCGTACEIVDVEDPETGKIYITCLECPGSPQTCKSFAVLDPPPAGTGRLRCKTAICPSPQKCRLVASDPYHFCECQ